MYYFEQIIKYIKMDGVWVSLLVISSILIGFFDGDVNADHESGRHCVVLSSHSFTVVVLTPVYVSDFCVPIRRATSTGPWS